MDERPRRGIADWPGHAEDPFYVWLQRGLHGAFDHVAAEPVPEEILKLIEEDKAERERLRQFRSRPRD